jgi:formyltetrahydrofolate-dependent phosphoribosylglycinamide formyltransferase
MTLKLAVLGSTKGTDMQAIIEAIEAGTLDAKIVAVISSVPGAFIIERAQKHNLESFTFNYKDYSSREEFDKKIIEVLKEKQADIVLLIGYNRILSDHFCQEYRYKIMNIHPSLLPAFAGGFDTNVHEEVLKAGVKVSGCTLHFVTEEVDGGPIIMQKAVEIKEGETPDSLKDKVQAAEQEVFLKAIKLYNEGKIKVEDKIVHVLE